MKRVPAEKLAAAMHRALAERGLSEEHRAYVVEGLLEASLRGIDTHGIRLFPTYLAELDGGRAKARPEIRWPPGAAVARLMDAGGALGLVAGRLAVEEVVRLAREHGAGAVLARNSNHFGAASCYSLAMARAGVLGIACTNSDALVAPFRGTGPLIGTNPISLAAFGEGEDVFCADFATSQVSYSRVKNYRERGEPLPAGWAVGPDGRDAAVAETGAASEVAALQPLGGYKGQCLGMMVEILCALLAGEPMDHELSHLYGEPYDTPRHVAHFFFGVNLAAYTDAGEFRRRLSRLLALVRGQEGAGGATVLAPGDPEEAAARRRRVEGIPLGAVERTCFEVLLQKE